MSATTLITGFPGFLATHLLATLASQHPTVQFDLLILPSTLAIAERRLRELSHDTPSLKDRARLIQGDISSPQLGLKEHDYLDLTRRTRAVWHLAALYNLAVAPQIAHDVNVTGTLNILKLCEAIPSLERLNYVSTCYVSGERTGIIREDELDCGQAHKNHYESTKFQAELAVQHHRPHLPITLFRPSIIVGDSRTGRTDKYDGPYYLFKLLHRMPAWMPMINIGQGDARVNMIPIDYACQAMTHLGTSPAGLDQVFHIADPAPMRARDVLELVNASFGRAGARGSLPAPLIDRLLQRASLQKLINIPREALVYFNHDASYDTSCTQRALFNTKIRPPHLSTYLSVLVDYYLEHPLAA